MPPPRLQAAHRLPDSINIDRESQSVTFPAVVCLDAGWLEQLACSPGTREHESILVVEERPSTIHAALLLAGFTPGRPGGWRMEEERLVLIPPEGDEVDVFVRYQEESGEWREEGVRAWIRDARAGERFPDHPWVFAGSSIKENPEFMGPGEHYVADVTGSVIGLVTFGDELLGFREVRSDQTDVQPPVWEVWTERVPPVGTRVEVILRRPAD